MAGNSANSEQGYDIVFLLMHEAACPRCVGRFKRGEGPGSGWCADCKPFIEAAYEIERLRKIAAAARRVVSTPEASTYSASHREYLRNLLDAEADRVR